MNAVASETQKIGVFLLPNDEDSRQLEHISAAIHDKVKSIVVLGEQRLPHITIAQFEAPIAAGNQLVDEVSQIGEIVTELTAAGLNFVPSHEENETWVEVTFVKTAALMQLHAKILDTVFGSTHRLLSGGGDTYRPHCTVARIAGRQTCAFDLDDGLFRQAFKGMKLVVGELGDNYTLKRVLT